MDRRRIYLSGSFHAVDEVREVAARFKEWGYEVTSSWLHEPPLEYDDPAAEEWQKRARANEDFLDIERSELVAVLTEWGSSSGGAHVELGMAAAMRKELYVVGPRLNVFHYLGRVDYWPDRDEWESHMQARLWW